MVVAGAEAEAGAVVAVASEDLAAVAAAAAAQAVAGNIRIQRIFTRKISIMFTTTSCSYREIAYIVAHFPCIPSGNTGYF